MSIQRWTTRLSSVREVASDDGEWVRYDDHVAALAEVYTLMGGAIESAIEAEQPRTLTADDPEPAVGSVVLADGDAWQRTEAGWTRVGRSGWAAWQFISDYAESLRLIHDGGQA